SERPKSRRAWSASGLRLSAFAISLCLLMLILGPVPALAQRPLGIDVSSFQTTITWSSVQAAGISFAWAKATEGTSYQDAYFIGNQNNGKAAGVLMGAYHYAHPELNTPGVEANYFWSFAGPYIKAEG